MSLHIVHTQELCFLDQTLSAALRNKKVDISFIKTPKKGANEEGSMIFVKRVPIEIDDIHVNKIIKAAILLEDVDVRDDEWSEYEIADRQLANIKLVLALEKKITMSFEFDVWDNDFKYQVRLEIVE